MPESSTENRPYVVRTDAEGVVTLTLDRGERFNPLSSGMIAGLRREIAVIADGGSQAHVLRAARSAAGACVRACRYGDGV